MIEENQSLGKELKEISLKYVKDRQFLLESFFGDVRDTVVVILRNAAQKGRTSVQINVMMHLFPENNNVFDPHGGCSLTGLFKSKISPLLPSHGEIDWYVVKLGQYFSTRDLNWKYDDNHTMTFTWD